MPLTYDEIIDIKDPRILAWLDIYETSFPYYERGPVSSHIADMYCEPGLGGAKKHRLATLDDEGNVVGIARYTYRPEFPLVYLIYFAVAQDQRNNGIGAAQFTELCRRIQLVYPEVSFFTWEVERPEKTRSKSGKAFAERRIEFYKRQGGILVRGTGHAIRNRPEYPRLPLDVMFYRLRPVETSEVLDMMQRFHGFPNACETVQIEPGAER